MKLVYAIIRTDNEDDVVSALMRNGFSVTRLATTGGFLRKGNVTLLIGTDDEKVELAIGVIRGECGESQSIMVNMPFVSGGGLGGVGTVPARVDVGGATIFVTNVERFEKF